MRKRKKENDECVSWTPHQVGEERLCQNFFMGLAAVCRNPRCGGPVSPRRCLETVNDVGHDFIDTE